MIALIATLSNCGSTPKTSAVLENKPQLGQKNVSQEYIATNGEEFPYRSLRLPENVIPVHYALFIHPNITQSHFKGNVTISCEIKKDTEFIVFHSKELNISHISVVGTSDSSTYGFTKFLEYKENEQIYVQLDSVLRNGARVDLTVVFEGRLIGKLAGFYKSTYQTKRGETRYVSLQ